MKIAVIGGDARMISLCRELELRGLSCARFALGEGSCASMEDCLRGAGALVLPMPLTRDGLTLSAPLHPEPLPLGDVLAAAPPGCAVLAGGAREGVVDYSSRESFLIENAALTAKAAALLLRRELDCGLENRRVLVSGFGRIGKLLALELRAQGAEVSVLSGSETGRAWARALGFEPGGGGFDAVLNTAPARIFAPDSLAALRGALYVELASAPGGCLPQEAEAAGLRHVAAPGLPGKFAPEAAGRALCRCVCSILEERGML